MRMAHIAEFRLRKINWRNLLKRTIGVADIDGMKSLALGILFMALASSCASTLHGSDFKRDFATETDVNKDQAACDMEAVKYARGAGWAVYGGQYNRMFDSCMRSKGYDRR